MHGGAYRAWRGYRYVWLYSFGSFPEPRPDREIELVPAISDTGFPTPLSGVRANMR